jgi:hypothetical protein
MAFQVTHLFGFSAWRKPMDKGDPIGEDGQLWEEAQIDLN